MRFGAAVLTVLNLLLYRAETTIAAVEAFERNPSPQNADAAKRSARALSAAMNSTRAAMREFNSTVGSDFTIANVTTTTHVDLARVADGLYKNNRDKLQKFAAEMLDQQTTTGSKRAALRANKNVKIKSTPAPTTYAPPGYGQSVETEVPCSIIGTVYIDSFIEKGMPAWSSAYYAKNGYTALYEGQEVPAEFIAFWLYDPLTTPFANNVLANTIIPPGTNLEITPVNPQVATASTKSPKPFKG